jgi:hypothetical protein
MQRRKWHVGLGAADQRSATIAEFGGGPSVGPGPKPPFGSRGFAAAQHLESSHPRHVPLGVSFWRRHFGKVDASPSAFELP